MNDYPSDYALFLLRQAVELFEMDQQCSDPGTNEWVWLQQARDILAEPETDNFQPTYGTPDFIAVDLDNLCRGLGDIKSSRGTWWSSRLEDRSPSEIYHDNPDCAPGLQIGSIYFEVNITEPLWHTGWNIGSSTWPSDPSWDGDVAIVPISDGEDAFESYTVEMAVEPAYESPDDILFAPVKTT